MLFVDLNFYLFFLVVFVLYWVKPMRKWQNLVLLAAGFVVYTRVTPLGAAILLISLVIEFPIIRKLKNDKQAPYLFWLGIVLNIILLAFLKYYNFFAPGVGSLLQSAGLPVSPRLLHLVLPAGFSFLALRRISYMIDIRKRTVEPPVHFMDYALYVSFFPQIISGPVDRAVSLVPQFQKERIWQLVYFEQAWPLIISGLFKKVVIADSLTVLVDKVFLILMPTGSQLILGTIAFSIQLLADFSAYTDLSRAFAYLLGIETPRNFNNPFLATNPGDFWNRWHITLSEWLRDYIFFPLRRNLLRKSHGRNTLTSIVIPPIVTMTVSGIWHGVGWTYLLWGLMHGIMLSVYQLIPRKRVPATFWGKIPGWILFTFLIQASWLVFRSPSLHWLGSVISQTTFLGTSQDISVSLVLLIMIISYSLLYIINYLLDKYASDKRLMHSAYYAVALLLVVIFISDASRDFIYGQF